MEHRLEHGAALVDDRRRFGNAAGPWRTELAVEVESEVQFGVHLDFMIGLLGWVVKRASLTRHGQRLHTKDTRT